MADRGRAEPVAAGGRPVSRRGAPELRVAFAPGTAPAGRSGGVDTGERGPEGIDRTVCYVV